MKKFVVLYHSPPEAMEFMATATPEQKAEGMKPWMDWYAECGDAVTDMGSPFGQGMEFKKDSSNDCSGAATGYTMIQAESMDGARKYVENHPHLSWMDGCSLQMFEAVEMGPG